MKKFTAFTCLAALAALLCSCSLRNETEVRHERLSTFGQNLVYTMSNGSVNALGLLLERCEKRIFTEGFDSTFTSSEELTLTVTKATEADSTWNVVSTANPANIKFNTTVRLLASEPGEIEHRWSCVGEGVYDEGNGYTCEVSCKDGRPAIYYWKRYDRLNYSYVSYYLVMTGEFVSLTKFNGKDVDRTILRYDGETFSYEVTPAN